jgi:biotin transport system substrate-specific component
MIDGQAIQGRVTLRSATSQAAFILAGAAALAVSARIAVPLPWTPVPVTAQTLAVLLVGALLGPIRGTGSVASYLLAGAAGLPVFAYGGGAAYLFGPTGGYLLGFIPAAFLAGQFVERGRAGGLSALLAGLAVADLSLFAFGMAWLALYMPLAALPLAGLLTFLPGEAIKIVLAVVVIRRSLR